MNLPILALIALVAGPERPDLSGRVTADSGEPVAGARVMIDSAAVRRGTSPICPSCYPDCRKSAETDAEGRFRIASVDPELLFNVLVVADGFRPTFARKSDPKSEPVAVTLPRFDPARFDPRLLLRGVVLDPDGTPLVGARVTPQGFSTEAFSGFGPDIFDPVAVTNLRGEFILTSKSPIEHVDVRVEGSGVAPRVVSGLRPERNPHSIRTTRGSTLTGRLIRNGQPVGGVMVGLVQASRASQSFLGDTAIGTHPDGRFAFLNVQPDDDCFVYGVMDSFRDGSAVAAHPIRTAGEGGSKDLGDLPVVAGHRVRGRVLLSDAKAVPPQTRLMLSREDAWDFRRVELDAEGRFDVAGLPTERYSLNVFLKGYRMSPKNHSISPDSSAQCVGTIDEDINALKILLEPGPR